MNLRMVFAAVALVAAAALIGGWVSDGLAGSKHDFSNEEWTGGDACAACHTPGRDELPKAAPLWDPKADLTRTFGTSLRQSQAAGGGTRMCLRCHDGTIARDTITAAVAGSASSASSTGRGSTGAAGGRSMSIEHPGRFTTGHGTSNHPVGVDYPPFRKDYRPASSVVASGSVTLPDGKVECLSCHDPHNMTGLKFMLVKSNARSALCLTCHRK
ncbi:MAG: cytochrome c3 family protein [Phycisphaerae bacterium]